MNHWKINNKSDKDVKLTLRVSNTKVIGLILKPKSFVVCMPYKTKQIDAQLKRSFIDIEQNYDNSYLNLNLGEIYEQGVVDKIKKESENYTK